MDHETMQCVKGNEVPWTCYIIFISCYQFHSISHSCFIDDRLWLAWHSWFCSSLLCAFPWLPLVLFERSLIVVWGIFEDLCDLVCTGFLRKAIEVRHLKVMMLILNKQLPPAISYALRQSPAWRADLRGEHNLKDTQSIDVHGRGFKSWGGTHACVITDWWLWT